MVKLIERKQEGKQASEQGRELDLGSHLAAQFQSATVLWHAHPVEKVRALVFCEAAMLHARKTQTSKPQHNFFTASPSLSL